MKRTLPKGKGLRKHHCFPLKVCEVHCISSLEKEQLPPQHKMWQCANCPLRQREKKHDSHGSLSSAPLLTPAQQPLHLLSYHDSSFTLMPYNSIFFLCTPLIQTAFGASFLFKKFIVHRKKPRSSEAPGFSGWDTIWGPSINIFEASQIF